VRLKESCLFVLILVCGSCWIQGQEFRSTTTVTSGNQPVTVDLTNVSDVHGASIRIHNSSSSTVTLPQISTPNNLMPISGPAILAQLNSLPPVNTDQDRAIQAWQYVMDHMHHYCYAGGNNSVIYDPISVMNGFGFGCCEQLDYVLAWIWQEEGYQARLAPIPGFHTVAEIYYGGAWHMLDPDHRVFYPKDDGTIASTQEVIANPNLVARVADANGNDPAGSNASDMANSYALYGAGLQYAPTVSPRPLSTVALRPFESLIVHSENLHDNAQFYSGGTYLSPSSVNSAELTWDLSFGNSFALRYAYAGSGIQVATDSSGARVLKNTSSSPGYIVYQEFSAFPVLGASVDAQFGIDSHGSLKAYVSLDGIHWPTVIPFQSALDQSSFDQTADITAASAGNYSYFVKIELDDGAQIHRLRIISRVQTARFFFPNLNPGSSNQLAYEDSSPVTQTRLVNVTTTIPAANHLIKGVRAQSLVPESVVYSISRDNAAANLVDGDPDSLAYPGGTHLDYLIQLNGSYHVTGVSIDWKYFGTDARYVKSWQLLANNGGQSWKTVAGGGFPGAATLDANVDTTTTALRIVADGTNWIGIYDLRLFGSAAAPSLPVSSLSATSNVPESPTYSLALNYGAASLVDGDPNTLAYPGSTTIDYSIALPAVTHLTSAVITWGYYGITPGYIDSWTLLGRNGADQPWTTLAQGTFPNTNSSTISFDFTADEMRIVANSLNNWIGIYELALYSPAPAAVSGLLPKSNIVEVGGTPASNLVDGDDSSVAAPGNTSVDYTVDAGQTTFIDSARLVWGSFGTDPSGMNSWRLLGLPPNRSTWEVIARGASLNSTETLIPVGNKYRKLRVAADGTKALGMNEVHLFGARMAVNSSWSVKSNVPESASSLANHYDALSLIDGDTTSLAYPGGPHLDYQISLGTSTQLSQAVIDWGVFGINSNYVNSWSLLGRTAPDQPWLTLAQGGFPDSGVTTVALSATVTDVRIVVDGSNWIGLYELQLR
jgi:hypothetical protein